MVELWGMLRQLHIEAIDELVGLKVTIHVLRPEGELKPVIDAWPECKRGASKDCAGEVDPKRVALGYNYCLACADPPKQFCSVNMHKSSAVLVTNKADLKFLGVQTPRCDGVG